MKNENDKQKAKILEMLDSENLDDNKTPETLDNFSFETALMGDDGVIGVKVSQSLNGVKGHDFYTIKPDDDRYEQLKKKHGLNQPGDSNRITEKWIDGKWVEVKE